MNELETSLSELEQHIMDNDYSTAKKSAMAIMTKGLSKDPAVAEKVKAIHASLSYEDPRLTVVNTVCNLLGVKIGK